LDPQCSGIFSRDTLQHLTSLISLEWLEIGECGLGELEPQLLAAAMGEMHKLRRLTLSKVYRDSPEDAAGNASALAALLRGLASRRQQMQSLTELRLHAVPVNRTAATALSKMHGLQVLELKYTRSQLDDSSIIQIVLELKPWLQRVDLSSNPGLTDACLPALRHAVPGLTVKDVALWGCPGMTQKGLQRYILGVESGAERLTAWHAAQELQALQLHVRPPHSSMQPLLNSNAIVNSSQLQQSCLQLCISVIITIKWLVGNTFCIKLEQFSKCITHNTVSIPSIIQQQVYTRLQPGLSRVAQVQRNSTQSMQASRRAKSPDLPHARLQMQVSNGRRAHKCNHCSGTPLQSRILIAMVVLNSITITSRLCHFWKSKSISHTSLAASGLAAGMTEHGPAKFACYI
jgi:hypothetical protein